MMGTINSPNSSIRVRGGHTRHKTASTKRIGSGDERKYIEHLEGELSAVQSELPSVAQEHTVKMNRINAENRQLQAQLKDWEMRYDEEVRDFVQQHNVVEKQLRSKNSNLEDYASRAKDRVMELESQLERMQQALEGAEAANVQLERRIEIMSELLTSAPAEAPTRRVMRPRPMSMLPRVPDHRGSWIGSPERAPELGAPQSPAGSYGQPRDGTPEMFEPLERIVSRGLAIASADIRARRQRPTTIRQELYSV
ncbi:hypothetical protein AMS68_004449 [Peltaster fructicola]|uniref:Uncharacterized protein n=1 Tax=Peltaster fructicola TaxID=286661 RepID=A0A6H0XVY4_9PEZI|nr:hypothetical protein AMS68_004449 [Peltaster fructicola]